MIVTGFILGLLGSMHCIGMCGPIALAIPVVNRTIYSKVLGILLYNLGRVLTYALLGLVFGFMGKAFIISGYQQLFSILLGAFILTLVVWPAKYSDYLSMTKIIAPL